MIAKFYTNDTEKKLTANLQDWHPVVPFNEIKIGKQ
jgi:hypothetical protein